MDRIIGTFKRTWIIHRVDRNAVPPRPFAPGNFEVPEHLGVGVIIGQFADHHARPRRQRDDALLGRVELLLQFITGRAERIDLHCLRIRQLGPLTESGGGLIEADGELLVLIGEIGPLTLQRLDLPLGRFEPFVGPVQVHRGFVQNPVGLIAFLGQGGDPLLGHEQPDRKADGDHSNDDESNQHPENLT